MAWKNSGKGFIKKPRLIVLQNPRTTCGLAAPRRSLGGPRGGADDSYDLAVRGVFFWS